MIWGCENIDVCGTPIGSQVSTPAPHYGAFSEIRRHGYSVYVVGGKNGLRSLRLYQARMVRSQTALGGIYSRKGAKTPSFRNFFGFLLRAFVCSLDDCLSNRWKSGRGNWLCARVVIFDIPKASVGDGATTERSGLAAGVRKTARWDVTQRTFPSIIERICRLQLGDFGYMRYSRSVVLGRDPGLPFACTRDILFVRKS